MKTLRLIGRIASRACIVYTILTLLLYTGGSLASGIEREWIPTLRMMYMVLVFSLGFSAACELVLRASLPAALRLVIHYAVTAGIFYVTFVVWGGYSASPASAFAILLAFTAVYAICAIVFVCIRRLTAAKKRNAQSYDAQFRHSSDR